MIRFLLLWVLVPLVLAVVAVVAPCYVFPLIGGSERHWCGYKSGPPHMEAQFVVGLCLGWAAAWLLWRRRHG
jgi:hypothetical protein